MRKLVAMLVLVLGAAAMRAQTWKLVWADEFEGSAGTAPAATNWGYETGNGGWGNGEIQMYCAGYSNDAPCNKNEPNTYLDGKGHLVIKAVKTDGGWTSGRMVTKGKHSFQYGRIEARMKLPVGAGFWPAFWMLGDTIDTEGWPKAGEQDIMEWVQKYGATTTSSTVHGPGYSGGKGISHEFTFPGGGRTDDNGFHTYGVVWAEDKLQFYRDDPGKPYFVLTPKDLPAGTKWVYNQPFFILLNFAIGSGGFPGATDGTTPKAGVVLVDYVRVYQDAAGAR